MIRRLLVTGICISALLFLPMESWGRGRGGAGGSRGGGGAARGGGQRGGSGAHGGGGFTGGSRGGPSGSRGGRSGANGAQGGFHAPSQGRSGFASPGQGSSRTPGGMNRASGSAGRPTGPAAGANRRQDTIAQGGPANAAGPGQRNQTPQRMPGDRTATPNRGQLNSFLGLPSDQGMQHLAANPRSSASQLPAQAAVARPPGRTAAGPRTNERSSDAVGRTAAAAAGYNRVSPSDRYTSASAVRANYEHRGLYGSQWHARYPTAWYSPGWSAGAAWNTCAWGTAAAYCGYAQSTPVYYDYGNNVTYEGTNVYVNGQDAGTAEQFFRQAESLAVTGASAQAPPEEDWLPLGVFALVKPEHTKSDVTIQIALNKQGILRGNYTDTATNKNQPIQGSLDKQTQRLAFSVGQHTQNIIETGLYNLTKDEAPCLVHVGNERTEQWLLVRLQPPNNAP